MNKDFKPEEFTFTVTRKVVDADGVPIREGSVLRSIKDDSRGVVTKIIRAGESHVSALGLEGVGDMVIQTSSQCRRISNQYDQWRHVPEKDQTFIERYESWLFSRHDLDSLRDLYSSGSKHSDEKVLAFMELYL